LEAVAAEVALLVTKAWGLVLVLVVFFPVHSLLT
jgi:hypothetical protein